MPRKRKRNKKEEKEGTPKKEEVFKGNYYIDNGKFYSLVKEYLRQKPPRQITEELGDMFILLANNIARRKEYINYSEDWKNEMKSDALYYCTKYADRFNPKKYDNPHAYFSMISINAFKMRIKKEKGNILKNGRLRKDIFEEFLVQEGLYKRRTPDIEDEANIDFSEADNIDDTIEHIQDESVFEEKPKLKLEIIRTIDEDDEIIKERIKEEKLNETTPNR